MSTYSFDFTGRNVFVMGGTSGINLGIAHGFAAAGAQVAVASRKPERVQAAVAGLATHGNAVEGYVCDVRDVAAVRAAFEGAARALGPIDVLISGAAGNFPAPAHGISPNGFKSVIDIDLIGTFHVMREAHPHLRKPGAAIVNISAPQAAQAMEWQVHVCAAKAGVDMITRVLAMEWGPEGIRVNSLVPGPIEGTEGMARLAPTPEANAAVAGSVPLRRQGTTADVARVAMFLASDAAAYVSGVVLPVDGGWSAGGVPPLTMAAGR